MRKWKVVIVILAVAAVAALGWVAVLWRRGPQVPSELACANCNLIIISLSNVQRRHLGIYGYDRPTTPNIDKFFKNSVRLLDGVAPASLTYTDSLSLFYSLYPYTHRLMSRGKIGPSQRVLQHYQDLPEILQKHGYYTAAFVSDEDYAYTYGLGKTFNLYFDRSFYPDYGILFQPWHYSIGTKDLVGPASDWLVHNRDHKFFLFVQFYDMHCPYTPGPKFKMFDPNYKGKINDNDCYMTLHPAQKVMRHGQPAWLLDSWFSMLKSDHKLTPFTKRDLFHLIAMYDGELRQADSRIAKLLQTIQNLGLLKNTIVIFMSEHGDYLGENGYYMKAALTAGGNLHNDNLGFPFLMRLPRLNKPLVYSPLFSLVDVEPTLLDLLGIRSGAARAQMQGLSLAQDLVQGRGVHDYVFAGSIRSRAHHFYRLEALQNREWKLTSEIDLSSQNLTPKFKLIHMSVDPNETSNVETQFPQLVKKMYNRIIKERDKYTPADHEK